VRRDLARLEGREFDVLVVGGGINGAGVARDAAMRGLSVALVEQADFASGTSSRSSKLVHGGVRYLEQGDFRLVRQASRERSILLRIAPHLVRPLPFLIPIYQDDRYGPTAIRLGMWLYDALALFRNQRLHRMLSAARAVRAEPGLKADKLRGAALYWDAQMDDARLCLANVESASRHDAVVANYVKVEELSKTAGRVRGARARDLLTARELDIAARYVVNAAGPWLDSVRSLDGASRPAVRLSKGTHIFVPRLTRRFAITIPSADGRVVFVIPWGDMSLLGTTDTEFSGDPSCAQPSTDEVAYILGEVRRIVPGHGLQPPDVIAAFSGVRSLARDEGMSTARVSREHHIEVSPSGLVSLAGGKYTTYRDVARQVVDLMSDRPCTTQMEALPRSEDTDGLEARVGQAVAQEMAVTLGDVMRRRTQWAFEGRQGLARAERVSHVMAGLLGWSEREREDQVRAYTSEVTF
jgi:glycerol-3-phosphate dehydrogenase